MNVKHRLAARKKLDDHPENVLDAFVDKKLENLERLRKCRFRMIQTTTHNDYIDPANHAEQTDTVDPNQANMINLPTGTEQQHEYAVEFQWDQQQTAGYYGDEGTYYN